MRHGATTVEYVVILALAIAGCLLLTKVIDAPRIFNSINHVFQPVTEKQK